MEGRSSEVVFESFNLNPQLFINEVLNSVDDVVDGAFEFYHRPLRSPAPTALRNWDGKPDTRSLRRETAHVGEQDSSNNGLLPHEGLCDPELDSQLDSLRKKLVTVGQESAELQGDILTLGKQSTRISHFDASVMQALQLYKNSGHEMYHGIGKSAVELQLKMGDLTFKSMDEEVGLAKVFNDCYLRTRDMVGPGQDLSVSLEDIQGSLSHIRSV